MDNSTKILVVDDEKNMRVTLAAILEDKGYSITTADTGEKAVELCEREKFDIVIMDVRMPGMGGVEAFRQIRQHKEGVKVILMSAYGVDNLKRAALDEGAIAFLSKPLDLPRMFNLISEAHDTAILVVENDQGEADRMEGNLREHGYRVTVTPSPHDALELVEQIRFDIILIDYGLPSMNGLDLYLAIKRITPTTVAILMTDLKAEFEQIAKEAISQTAYTVLKKPLDLDDLLGLLQRITGQQASGEIRKPPIET
jgi:DNA-binding NtrC family response regulator